MLLYDIVILSAAKNLLTVQSSLCELKKILRCAQNDKKL